MDMENEEESIITQEIHYYSMGTFDLKDYGREEIAFPLQLAWNW